jgi:hypothetical protein
MGISDIFTLRSSIAPRLIRCLYIVALVLIAIMVVLGVVRGIRIMSFTPRPMPVIGAPPPGATPSTPPQTAMPPRPGNRMMMRRFRRPGMMGPRAPFGLGRNPVAAGAFTIFFALLRGAITLLVVRILAEIGLAILAMPRRQEI